MQEFKTHLAVKLLCVALVATLFTPSVTKFAHIFAHHEHKLCVAEGTTHIHQVDLDCEFYKFQINKNFTLQDVSVNLFVEKNIYQNITSQYIFVSDYQKLHFSLRGPPQINLV